MRNRYDFQIAENDENKNDSDSENGKYRLSVHSLPFYVGVVFLIALVGLFGIAILIQGILPRGLTIADEAASPNEFIAERAQKYLKELTAFGPRVVGSYENEVLSVDFLKKEIGTIMSGANKNQSIEMDVQVVSGAYFLDYKPKGAINSYGEVQNVVVKVSGRDGGKYGVLINSHFDSVPTSPGGSDDGINCAVMLEVLRKIVSSPVPPKHNIVFLFNGAEETILQAAHGFITQHKWAKLVNVVVNLEAAGAGGKIMLFQTGPRRPWLMRYYSNVPHPAAQATGEELFQSNMIPSDTDFRIFRDFGGLIGYDMAFIKNGYRYHTKYDDFEHIPLGSFQHVGDNTLSLVRDLSNAPELSEVDQQSIGDTTFYDVFGVFVISYNDTLGIILNAAGILLSVGIFIKSLRDFGMTSSLHTFKYLGLTLAFTLGGWILSACLVYLLAYTIDIFYVAMSWYRQPWIVGGIYVIPVIASCCIMLIFMNHWFSQRKISLNVQAQMQIHIARLIWTCVLLVGSFFGIRSVYVLLIPIGFNAVTFIILHVLKLHRSVRCWLFLHLGGTIIPTLFVMVNAVTLGTFIIPICGRIGQDRNPEIIVGFITMFVTLLIMWVYVPLITLLRMSWIVLAFLGSLFLLTFIFIFTPLGFPYTGDTDSPAPQRFWIFHHSRTFKNESNGIIKSDSGFYSLNWDRNSPHLTQKYVKSFEYAVPLKEDCEMAIFCGIPLVSPRQIAIIDTSTWIAAEKPIFYISTNFTLNSKELIKTGLWRYNVTINGPSRMSVIISPKLDIEVTNISLVSGLPSTPATWNRRKVYLIVRTWGKTPEPLTFSLDVKVPGTWKNQSTAVEIGVNSMYVDTKKNKKIQQYEAFLAEFPNWIDTVAYLSSFDSWYV